MLFDTYLRPDNTARLLHLLQAARPFLTPSWCNLADLCIRFLTILEFAANPHRYNLHHLLSDARNCTPTDNMDALLCAIRPFCLEEELKLLQMFEQFQQMQQAMDLWKMFSDFAPDFMQNMDTPLDFMQNTDVSPTTNTVTDTSFLSFLSPEQRMLYDTILAEEESDAPSLPT